MTLRSRFLAAFLLLAALPGARADIPAVIARARAYYGPEESLEAIRSIHYRGRLVSTETDASGEQKSVEAAIEIIFQKPDQQRIVATGPEKVEITVLDGYEGWQRIELVQNQAARRTGLLVKDQVKRLRANTWEHLSYFKGIEEQGGRVDDQGQVDLDGRPARKLAFVHDDEIVFTRYFCTETGQLLQTETEQGARFTEEGELEAGGVRFPRRVITRLPLDGGGQRTVTVEFESVQLNETFPAELFQVPFLSPRRTVRP